MRAKMLQVDAPADAHRHRRHRRRRRPAPTTSPPARPWSLPVPACRRQARQPRAVLEVRRGRHAGRARRQHRAWPRRHIARCIREAGIGFMFAPHASRGHAPCRPGRASSSAPARSSTCSGRCPIRPASSASSSASSRPNGSSRWPQVLGKLGSERAWVVHGEGGLDEMTTTGATQVAELQDGKVRELRGHAGGCRPEARDRGRSQGRRRRRTTPRRCATCSRASQGAYRDIVLLNAAAALVVAGKAGEPRRKARRWRPKSIDDGQGAPARSNGWSRSRRNRARSMTRRFSSASRRTSARKCAAPRRDLPLDELERAARRRRRPARLSRRLRGIRSTSGDWR